MLGRISGTGVGYLLGLMKPANRQAEGKVAAGDNAAAEGMRSAKSERAQDALDALNNLKTAVQSQKQQRKAAAKAKVDRLKAELDNLRLMSGGDPKAVARRAAQIARELAAAAKEYASSGGSGMAAGGPAQSGGDADASAQAGAGGDASAQAVAGQAGAGAAGTGTQGDTGDADAQAQAEAKAATAEADAAARKAGEDVHAAKSEKKKEPGAENTIASDEDARRLAAETFQQMAADVSRQGGEKRADSEFAAEVRRLMAAVKSLVAQARRRVEQTGEDDEMDRLVKQVKQAEADMEASFSAAPEMPAMPVNIVV